MHRNAHICVENTTLLTWRIPADGRMSKSPGRSTRPQPCRPVRSTGGADGDVRMARRWPGPSPSWHSDGTGGICRRSSTPIGTVPTGRGTKRSWPSCPPSTATKTTAAAATRTVFYGTRPPTSRRTTAATRANPRPRYSKSSRCRSGVPTTTRIHYAGHSRRSWNGRQSIGNGSAADRRGGRSVETEYWDCPVGHGLQTYNVNGIDCETHTRRRDGFRNDARMADLFVNKKKRKR